MVKVKTFASPLKIFQARKELEGLDDMVNKFIEENKVQKVISVSDACKAIRIGTSVAPTPGITSPLSSSQMRTLTAWAADTIANNTATAISRLIEPPCFRLEWEGRGLLLRPPIGLDGYRLRDTPHNPNPARLLLNSTCVNIRCRILRIRLGLGVRGTTRRRDHSWEKLGLGSTKLPTKFERKFWEEGKGIRRSSRQSSRRSSRGSFKSGVSFLLAAYCLLGCMNKGNG